MEEAAKTERKNAKSLNRWEESEKKRAEDQKAKLEALHSRQLSGPVISMWSGLARWVNGRIEQLGVKTIRKAGFKEEAVKSVEEEQQQPLDCANTPSTIANNGPQAQWAQKPGQPSYSGALHSSYAHPVQFAIPQGPYGFLEGIHAYAAMPIQQHQGEFAGTAEQGSRSDAVPPAAPVNYYGGGYHIPPITSSKGPDIEYSSRNLIALKNIDANALRRPEIQDSALIKKARTKLQSMSLPGLALAMVEAG